MPLLVVFVSRHALVLTALFSWAVLAVSLGLQWGLDLVPCPMCIVQRAAVLPHCPRDHRSPAKSIAMESSRVRILVRLLAKE